jgi:hypothetical protein
MVLRWVAVRRTGRIEQRVLAEPKDHGHRTIATLSAATTSTKDGENIQSSFRIGLVVVVSVCPYYAYSMTGW